MDPTCHVDSRFQLCDSVFVIIFIQTETYHDFMKDSSSDLIEPLMPPMVRIQGGRNRLSSEICSYSDYEFPLDEAWEIAPRNRLVDSLIKLNNLCSAASVLGLPTTTQAKICSVWFEHEWRWSMNEINCQRRNPCVFCILSNFCCCKHVVNNWSG